MTTKPAALALTIAASAALSLGAAALPATTAHATLPATRVTAANLPTAQQFNFYSLQARTTSTIKGHPATLPVCQTRTWAALGANAEFTRTYRLTYPGSTTSAKAMAQVASFPSHATAVAAATKMAASLDCTRLQKLPGYMPGTLTIDKRAWTLRGGQPVRTVAAYYGIKSHTDHIDAEHLGVTVTGTHVELLSVDFGTQDYWPEAIRSTVVGTLPALAR